MGTQPAAMYSTTLMPKCSSVMVCRPATAPPSSWRSSEKGAFTICVRAGFQA